MKGMSVPITDATLNLLGNDLAGYITHFSIHTADPGTTGANEAAVSRVAASWAVDADGDLTAANAAFTGGTPNGPVTHIGYWSAASGGTFRGSRALTGDATFNAAGEYTVASVTENLTSS